MTRIASDDRVTAALKIRDHVLPAVRARGTMTPVGDGLRIATLKEAGWTFAHFTPFNPIAALPSARTHQGAMLLQVADQAMPYGLDIWCGRKMMSIRWDDERLAVVSFSRGAWETELLAGLKFMATDGCGPGVRLWKPELNMGAPSK